MGEEYDVPWEYARRAGGARLSSMRGASTEGAGGMGAMPMVSTTSHDCISTSSTSSLRYPGVEPRGGGGPLDLDDLSLSLFRPSSSTESASQQLQQPQIRHHDSSSSSRRRSTRGRGPEELQQLQQPPEGGEGRRRRVDESCIVSDMDRVEAEKRLHERTTGDFVLRWREDGASAALSLRAYEGVLHLKIERVNEKWVVGEGARFRSISQAISFYRKNPLPIRGARHICLLECLSSPPPSTTTTTARL